MNRRTADKRKAFNIAGESLNGNTNRMRCEHNGTLKFNFPPNILFSACALERFAAPNTYVIATKPNTFHPMSAIKISRRTLRSTTFCVAVGPPP